MRADCLWLSCRTVYVSGNLLSLAWSSLVIFVLSRFKSAKNHAHLALDALEFHLYASHHTTQILFSYCKQLCALKDPKGKLHVKLVANSSVKCYSIAVASISTQIPANNWRGCRIIDYFKWTIYGSIFTVTQCDVHFRIVACTQNSK